MRETGPPTASIAGSMNRSQKLGIALSLFLALCLCLSACGSHESRAAAPVKATPSPRSTPLARAEPSDNDESRAEADDDKSDDEEDSDTDAKDFHGYPCTKDCSGHEAGYSWAEEHDIHDPDKCGGKSQSFIEGCRAWAEENP